MAQHLCFFLNKGLLMIKPPKISPLFLRTLVLVFAMICGVYMCSISLNQSNNSIRSNLKIRSLQVIQRWPKHYNSSNSSSTNPKLHYPKPHTFNRVECEYNPVRFFVIISMQRSGSGWFETLLNSHINVSSNGELFSVKERRDNISSIVKTLDKVYNLDWFTSASKNQCSAAVGFKWMLNQGLMEHHEEIVKYFNKRGVSLIFLFRKNLLRRMVSMLANAYDRYAKLLNGTHKSHVHSIEEARTLSKYKPTINSTTLINDLQQMETMAANTLEYFNSTRHMVLYYEDLLRNHTKLTDEVQELLQIPRMELKSRQVKIHKGALSEHVDNWDEVNSTLKGTIYEKFLQRTDY